MINEINTLVAKLGEKFQNQQLTLAVAESCTGGGISHCITEVSGSSAWFDCGFVTYSNRSKMKMLAVHFDTLEQFGAVSEQVAIEMAEGVLIKSEADSALSVTGIAGPLGGHQDKPVGTVFIAWKNRTAPVVAKKYLFKGNRQMIRQQTIIEALNGICIP